MLVYCKLCPIKKRVSVKQCGNLTAFTVIIELQVLCLCPGLEVQDISDPDEFYNEKHLNKGGEKERGTENLTENIFATGGQQVPANTSPVGSDNVTDNALAACGQPVLVVNSPADIYKYFPWILTYEETVQEDLNSKRLKFVR